MTKTSRMLGHALLAAGMFGMAFAGAAVAQEKLIVGIYKSGTQQYFIDEAAGFAKAAEAAGYTAKIINVELDATSPSTPSPTPSPRAPRASASPRRPGDRAGRDQGLRRMPVCCWSPPTTR